MTGKYKDPEYKKKFYKRNKDVYRDRLLQTKYGITLKQWNDLWLAQGERCAICGCTEHKAMYNWHTDHDHATGKVRGILCQVCNTSLGFFEKLERSPELVALFRSYLNNRKD